MNSASFLAKIRQHGVRLHILLLDPRALFKGTTMMPYMALVGIVSIVAFSSVTGIGRSTKDTIGSDALVSMNDPSALASYRGPKPFVAPPSKGAWPGMAESSGSAGTTGTSPSATLPPRDVLEPIPTAPSWVVAFLPGQENVQGGFTPGSWIVGQTVTAPVVGTATFGPDVRVVVNGGTRTSGPVYIAAGDSFSFDFMPTAPYGEGNTWNVVINGTTLTLSAPTRPAPDTTPDDTVLASLADTPEPEPGMTMIVSRPVVLSGVESGVLVDVSVSGPEAGQVSVNNGPWRDSDTAVAGDTIVMRWPVPEEGVEATYTLRVGDSTTTTTVRGPTVPSKPESRVGAFDFGQRTLAWNEGTWRVYAPYQTIPGLENGPLSFVVEGDGNAVIDSNITSGTGKAGTVSWGTNLVVDAPMPGQSYTATLVIDGTAGSFVVTRDPMPNRVVNKGGDHWFWIPTPSDRAVSFEIKGKNAAAAVVSSMTVSESISSRRALKGTVRGGFNLVVKGPKRKTQETITVTLDGHDSIFTVARP